MIVGALDQCKEVFNGADLVIDVQWFSRLCEYGAVVHMNSERVERTPPFPFRGGLSTRT